MPLKLRHISGGIAAASGKISPNNCQNSSQLLTYLIGWIWNYAVVQVTQPGISAIGYKFFIVWAILNFTWFWTVYCRFLVSVSAHEEMLMKGFITVFYPETSGKTLEQLDFIFMKEGDRQADFASFPVEVLVAPQVKDDDQV